MKYLLILVVALTLAGCKGKFVETERGESYTEIKKESCKHSSFCSYYDYNKGKYRTGFSHKCSGHRQVEYKITPVSGYYEKEPKNIVRTTDRHRVRILTKCK